MHQSQESPAEFAGDAWLASAGDRSVRGGWQEVAGGTNPAAALGRKHPQIQRLLPLLEEESEISEKYLQTVDGQFPALTLLRAIPGYRSHSVLGHLE
jgi:hypothetical protein